MPSAFASIEALDLGYAIQELAQRRAHESCGAVIDNLSNGRFMLGPAVGYKSDEFAGYGVDRRYPHLVYLPEDAEIKLIEVRSKDIRTAQAQINRAELDARSAELLSLRSELRSAAGAALRRKK